MLHCVFIVLVTECHYVIFLWLMQIDEEILQEVVKMGFDRNQLLDSLRSRVQNEVSVFTTHSPYDLQVFFSWVVSCFRVL